MSRNLRTKPTLFLVPIGCRGLHVGHFGGAPGSEAAGGQGAEEDGSSEEHPCGRMPPHSTRPGRQVWLVRVEWGTRFESDHLSAFIYDWKPVFGDKLLDDGVGRDLGL